MTRSVILAGCRTPIGKFQGALSEVSATKLGGIAVKEAIVRAGVSPNDVSEVIMGNILSAGLGQAPARQAALAAGLPPQVAALTVNKMCGSGLKAVMLADQAIRAGDEQLIVAGGMESMTRAPHLLMGARSGWKFGHQQVLDSMIHDGLWCAFENQAMGAEADYIAQSKNVSRADQDAFALESHTRAVAAMQHGKFTAEMTPVRITNRRGEIIVSQDEGPRPDTTAQGLASLKPSFSADGTATPGNASQISDGAAAVVVSSDAFAKSVNTPFKFAIVAAATSGVPPKELFIAPVLAVRKVLKQAKRTLRDIDLIEMNEAFSSQCLACARELELPLDRTNVNGGAVALGHPIGASGARVLVTLLHAMVDRKLQSGLATLCLGGGNAVAMIVDRI